MEPQLLIVADDLTGAADTGACFAAAGFATVIPLGDAPVPAADVVVLSTETRDLAGVAAARQVTRAIARIRAEHGPATPPWVYKKIDSALRGSPGEELLATMAAHGATHAIVAPAFPAEGRTTVGGVQFVDGRPLAESHLGDAHAASRVASLFEAGEAPVRLLDLLTVRGGVAALGLLLDGAPSGLVIADAETDDDLDILAQAVSRGSPRLLCGTAGFARALAGALPLRPGASPAWASSDGGRPMLIVAGSQHPATARQIDVLRDAGAPVVVPSLHDVAAGSPVSATLVAEVASHLCAGRSTVLTTVGLCESPLTGRALATTLARIATAPEVISRAGSLLLTGGDVAAEVCVALGASALWLRGEIAPGQPWGALAGGLRPGLPVATKAGSFGDDQAMATCVAYLAGEGSGPRQEPRAASIRSR